uniref:IFT80 second beta-propeller domain-containing protein n=1 Tax=Chromera velia CCMP2878 TaxID=1169474 RepID=A0A0G4GHL8_9ALVE|eukprot:Cvel_21917.t1-p1 / transcript=Cvel_21917.t1 / gene=Cvel_21917 / organism=Chromera_velia_CCMP2878 / gene_product=Intraflagellar transport protein 80 homolog, putative / transcript_product=Intraflagellar transport protein 80 homolog, putative / location=Cvel_scaffold2101:180-4196(-) / protein_length=504 / sequence_SO=supercontig / SO=protein_coding / is_pseudo=false
MRLKLLHNPSVHGHTAYCAGVGWTKTGQQHELYSVSDDQSILKWNADGSLNGKVCDYSGSSESAKGGNTFCTSMQFLPAASGRGAAADSYLALACADGSFRLLNKSGKEEKRVDNAHTGAVICIRWNHDGSAIATAGEDGLVKIWSRSAMPRSTIAQHSRSVYAVCWSPDSEAVVYAYEKRLVIKPLQPRQRAIEWHAHEGVALQVDWSPVNNLIVSAGEDRQYKIWDSYGRPVFSGPPLETVATCISWAPNGRCFAVGCHNTVKLCDRTGWTYGRETAETGSITQVAWSPDGTRFGASGGNGSVVFGFVSERSMLWQHLDATLEDSGTIVVRDLNRQASETLHFRDRVMDFSLGFGALVATTSTQLHIYNSSNWSACHTEDLKEPATLIAQAPSLLALVDSTAISVYSYEGRLLSTIRVPGLRTEFLNHSTLAVAKDAVCIVDAQNPRVIRLFDAHTGKAMGSPVEHKVEVEVVALNHHGGGGDRKIALMDKNKDVFISLAHK